VWGVELQSEKRMEAGPPQEDIYSQLKNGEGADDTVTKSMALELMSDHLHGAAVEEEGEVGLGNASPTQAERLENALLNVVLATLQQHTTEEHTLKQETIASPPPTSLLAARTAPSVPAPLNIPPSPSPDMRDSAVSPVLLQPTTSTEHKATAATPITHNVGVATSAPHSPPEPSEPSSAPSAATAAAAKRSDPIERFSAATLESLRVALNQLAASSPADGSTAPAAMVLPKTPPTPASCASSDDYPGRASSVVDVDEDRHQLDAMGSICASGAPEPSPHDSQHDLKYTHDADDGGPPTPPSPSSVASSIDLHVAFRDFLPEVLRRPPSTPPPSGSSIALDASFTRISGVPAIARPTSDFISRSQWAADPRTRGLKPAAAATAGELEVIHVPDASVSPETAAGGRVTSRGDRSITR
jgi:hypothetical protein